MQESQRQSQTAQYDPYPHQRPGPVKNDQRKSEIVPDVTLRPFNFATRPVPSIRKFIWEDIKAVAISDSGQQGVIFVESSDGAIVVKGSQDAAVDYFLYKLSRVLYVSVPQMRVLRWYDNEFKKVISSLERATFNDETLGRRITSRIDMAFIQIQEYIPGISIQSMGPHRAAKVFDHVTPESRDRLIRLGQIIAFDTLINNSDRYPLIWNSEGNPENVIVSLKTTFLSRTEQLRDPENLSFDFGRFYALDSGLSQMRVETEQGLKALARYYSRLENFLNELFMDMQDVMTAKIDPLTGTNRKSELKGMKSISSITTFIYQHTLYSLSDMQVLQIMIGIVIGVENTCQLGIDRIQAMYQKFFLKESDDWRGYWNDNLRRINLMMYNDCILIYQKFRAAFGDVIKWVKDITLNQYHIRIEEFDHVIQGDPMQDEEPLETSNGNIFEDEGQDQEGQVGGSLNFNLDNSKDKASENNEDGKNSAVQQDIDPEYENDLHKKIKNIFDLDIDELHQNIINSPEQPVSEEHRASQQFNKQSISSALKGELLQRNNVSVANKSYNFSQQHQQQQP